MAPRILVSVSVLLLAATAIADDSDDESFSRSGWYGGVGVSGNIYILRDLVEKDTDGLFTVNNTVGFNLRGGYRATSWFAAELIYEYAPGFNLETAKEIDLSTIRPGLPTVPSGTEIFGITGNTVTLNAKFLLPFWRAQPYLNLGVGPSIISLDDRFDLGEGSRVAFGARLAVGGDIYITKNLLLFLEFSALLTTFDLGDPTSNESISLLYYVSPQGGLQWRF